MSDLQANGHDDLLDSLLGDFLDESDQLLTQLNERLLQLGRVGPRARRRPPPSPATPRCSTRCSARPTASRDCRPCWDSRTSTT